MGVTYSLECAKCGIEALEIGDFGHIGAPSLEQKARRRGLRPFGLIHAACAAVGLLSEELEATAAFLEAHRGHPVRLLGDGVAEGDDGEVDSDEDEDEGAGEPRTFRWKKGKFVDSFHVVHCAKCDKTARSTGSTPLRPFTRRTLTAEDVKTFLAGSENIDEHIYRAGSPFEFLDDVWAFVAKHKDHSLAVWLDEGERAQRVSASLRVKAPAVKTVPSPDPAWTEEDDEKRLTAPRDESLWDALRGLRHMRVEVRRRAIARLRGAGDPGVFAHAVSALMDPDAEVRAIATAILGTTDDPRRLAPLGRASLDHNRKVRSAAAHAMAVAGLSTDAAHRAALAPTPEAPTKPQPTGSIEKDLFSPIAETRATAVGVLASKVNEKSLTWLSKALADPTSTVRRSAATALGRHLEKNSSAVPWLLIALDDYSRWVATDAVKAAGTPNGDALVERIEAMVDDERVFDGDCVDSLVGIKTEKAQRAIARLLNHPKGHLRGQAAYALTKLRPVHVIPELTVALSHVDPDVASLASSALAKLPFDLVLPTLIEAFKQRPNPRFAILSALESRNEKVLHRLFRAGLRDRSMPARMCAARWLARRDDEPSKAALIAAARRGDGTVAAVIWEFLLARGEPGTEAGLEKAFRDAPEPDLMAAAFIYSGNKKLAAAARRHSDWRPKKFPKIRWGGGGRQ